LEASRAADFARAWVAAWNAHDIERILSHYTDDVEMTSRYVGAAYGEGGTARGKAAVRDYWTNGLARVPDMRLELIDVFAGVDSIAIYYKTTLTGATALDVLELAPDGRARRGHAHYTVPPQSPPEPPAA
jgi:ketosteroid isomerase-like protein